MDTPAADRLFQEFLDYLRAPQPLPNFLAAPAQSSYVSEPYQMVAEWIALRHEVKQQGKSLRSSQEALQKALESLQAERQALIEQQQLAHQQLASRYEEKLVAQQRQLEREQENWLKELLKVVDALESACTHWQQTEAELLEVQTHLVQQVIDLVPAPAPATANIVVTDTPTSSNWWQSLLNFLNPPPKRLPPARSAIVAESAMPTLPATLTCQVFPALQEIWSSSREGVELTRRILLDVLRQQQVVPLEVMGQPFDGRWMYAVDRRILETLPPGTVVQEVVRGYKWGDRILREAQVVVATSSTSPQPAPESGA